MHCWWFVSIPIIQHISVIYFVVPLDSWLANEVIKTDIDCHMFILNGIGVTFVQGLFVAFGIFKCFLAILCTFSCPDYIFVCKLNNVGLWVLTWLVSLREYIKLSINWKLFLTFLCGYSSSENCFLVKSMALSNSSLSPIIGRRPGSGTLPGSNQSIPTSGLGSSSSPHRGPSPHPRQAPTVQAQRPALSGPQSPPYSVSPTQRTGSPTSRAESSLRKTGSSVDYTSTQWESDEDESESEEEDQPAFAPRGPARPGFPTPQSRQTSAQRQQQPSPAPRQQVKTITSKPLASADDDDWLDSDRYCGIFEIL